MKGRYLFWVKSRQYTCTLWQWWLQDTLLIFLRLPDGTNKSARKKEEACPLKKIQHGGHKWLVFAHSFVWEYPVFTHGKLRLMLHFFIEVNCSFNWRMYPAAHYKNKCPRLVPYLSLDTLTKFLTDWENKTWDT